jgi:hypothetical protein
MSNQKYKWNENSDPNFQEAEKLLDEAIQTGKMTPWQAMIIALSYLRDEDGHISPNEKLEIDALVGN